MTRIRHWATWQLPMPSRVLVVAVITGYALAIGASVGELVALPGAGLRSLGPELAMCCVFVVAAVVSAEVSMRLAWPRTRQDRVSRELLTVWLLPIALVLPPAYVMISLIAARVYLYLRVWHAQAIKAVYNTAAAGLAYGTASLLHRALLHASSKTHLTPAQFTGGAAAAAILLISVAAYCVVHSVLVGAVVVLTAGKEALGNFLKDREGLVVDIVGICLGIVAAVAWVADPVFAVFLLPPVLLLEHQLFSGLRRAVRTDLLTEVANPQYWREVAGREVERASSSGDHLAVLMVDIDHFKAVNDKYGHLAGDEVLAAVARTVAQALRPRDLVGRLGGEEFGAVLSGLNLLDAEGAAERLRSQVRDVRVRADSGDWISVTVSVGVSELSVTGGDLRQLLDAADVALYAAKAAGRDCVRAATREPGTVIDLSIPDQRAPAAEKSS